DLEERQHGKHFVCDTPEQRYPSDHEPGKFVKCGDHCSSKHCNGTRKDAPYCDDGQELFRVDFDTGLCMDVSYSCPDHFHKHRGCRCEEDCAQLAKEKKAAAATGNSSENSSNSSASENETAHETSHETTDEDNAGK
ncbi:unnamed protein product, partial [Effrenium voratum]